MTINDPICTIISIFARDMIRSMMSEMAIITDQNSTHYMSPQDYEHTRSMMSRCRGNDPATLFSVFAHDHFRLLSIPIATDGIVRISNIHST